MTKTIFLFKFTFIEQVANFVPLWIVCSKKLFNSAMVSHKLKCHVESKHPFKKQENVLIFFCLVKHTSKTGQFYEQKCN